ncbi:MAG: cupin domain-containing protein [Anaerolineae bacterium]|nr:cupin domain-containing protein [Anaerolineae bacterium]
MFEIKNFVYNTDVPFEELGGGIKRKVLAYHDNLMAVEVYFETGAEGTIHFHPHEQITYVLKGKFEFNIDGNKRIIKPGDTTFQEPNVPHGVVCLEEGILLDVFTPHREDFV